MSERGPVFRLRLLSSNSNLERVGRFTPYALESIVDAARRMGAEGWLDLAISADADTDCLAVARRRFEPLAARGLHVRVRSEPGLDGLRPAARPVAA